MSERAGKTAETCPACKRSVSAYGNVAKKPSKWPLVFPILSLVLVVFVLIGGCMFSYGERAKGMVGIGGIRLGVNQDFDFRILQGLGDKAKEDYARGCIYSYLGAALYLVSLILALPAIITSFCFRQTRPGLVLSITAAVLFLPSLLCGTLGST